MKTVQEIVVTGVEVEHDQHYHLPLENCDSFVDKWVSSHSFGNKKEIVSRYSKDTCVNKVKNKEIYFCCINDLKGYIPDDEVEQIHREFAKNFNIIGVVRDYASRGSKSLTNSAKIEGNPNSTTYEAVGTVEHIQKQVY